MINRCLFCESNIIKGGIVIADQNARQEELDYIRDFKNSGLFRYKDSKGGNMIEGLKYKFVGRDNVNYTGTYHGQVVRNFLRFVNVHKLIHNPNPAEKTSFKHYTPVPVEDLDFEYHTDPPRIPPTPIFNGVGGKSRRKSNRKKPKRKKSRKKRNRA